MPRGPRRNLRPVAERKSAPIASTSMGICPIDWHASSRYHAAEPLSRRARPISSAGLSRPFWLGAWVTATTFTRSSSRPAQRLDVEHPGRVVRYGDDLDPEAARGGEHGEDVARVLRVRDQHAVALRQRHREEGAQPRVGGAGRERDVPSVGADQAPAGGVDRVDPLGRLVVGLVAADLRLAEQVRDHRVDHDLRRQRGARVVEVVHPGSARGCRPAAGPQRRRRAPTGRRRAGPGRRGSCGRSHHIRRLWGGGDARWTPSVGSGRGRAHQGRGHRPRAREGPHRRGRPRLRDPQVRRRRQPQGPLPVPRRAQPVVQRQPRQGRLVLLRVRRGRRRHRLPAQGRPPLVHRGRREARRPLRRHPPVRRGLGRAQPAGGHPQPAHRGAQGGGRVLRRAAREPRGRDRARASSPSAASTRRRRRTSASATPPRAGTSCSPTCAARASPTTSSSRAGWSRAAGSAASTTASAAAWSGRSATPAATSSASAPASSTTTTRARSTSTPRRPRSTRRARCSTASTSPARRSPSASRP